MKRLVLKWILKILYCERGGGGTEIQQAPPVAAPDPGESAAKQYQARLQYDPLVAQMESQLQQQYYPQQAALQAALYQQYAPLAAGTQEQLRRQYSPTQYAATEMLGQRALTEMGRGEDPLLQQLRTQAGQQLQSPMGYTPEQQSAIDAIRGRQMGKTQEAIRTQANLGGSLYGGRTQRRESEAMQHMGQAFAQEDTQRQLAQQQQAFGQAAAIPGLEAAQRAEALRYTIPVAQQIYPQMQFPGMPATQQVPGASAVPSADVLYNAMYGASRPEYFATQKPDYFGSVMGGLGSAIGGLGAGGFFNSSKRFKHNIKLWGKPSILSNN